MRIVIAGATGMVGGLVLRHALVDERVCEVTTVGRRSVGLEHPKLREIRHDDFRDCRALEDELAGHDAAFFCLGAYSGSMSDEQFRQVTVEYPIAFGRALVKGSPGATLCLLSGRGADPSERSRMAFARYKGAAEKALFELGFARVRVFRPAYIFPVEPRREPNIAYRVMRVAYPLLRRVYPDVGIASDDLALAMLHAGLGGPPEVEQPVLENATIRALASRLRSDPTLVRHDLS